MGTAKFLNSQAHAVPASSTGQFPAGPATKTLSVSQAVASAGTVVTLMVPEVGKRFRIVGGWLTPSAADTITLRTPASVSFQLNVRSAANTLAPILLPPEGRSAASANLALVLDVGTAATIVTGTIFYSEEP